MEKMDIIKINGGNKEKLLDVGGGENEKKVKEELKIIKEDKKVNEIMVNIFGGIMRCDVIDEGIVDDEMEIKMKVKIV
jgi:succinyl-CoA synthetase beta subunit